MVDAEGRDRTARLNDLGGNRGIRIAIPGSIPVASGDPVRMVPGWCFRANPLGCAWGTRSRIDPRAYRGEKALAEETLSEYYQAALVEHLDTGRESG
jgi:hypothetical protein